VSIVEELIDTIPPTFEFMGYLLRIFGKRSLREKNFFQNSLGFYALSCLKSSGFDISFDKLKNWLKSTVNNFLDGNEPLKDLFERDNFIALCFGIKALTEFDEFSLDYNGAVSLRNITQEIAKRRWLEDIRNSSIFLFSFCNKVELADLTAIAKGNIERNYARFKAEGNIPQQIYSIFGLSCLNTNLDKEIEAICERYDLDIASLSTLLLSSKDKNMRSKIYRHLVNSLRATLDGLGPYLSDFLSALQMKKLDFDENKINDGLDLITMKNTSRWKFEVELEKSLKAMDFVDVCLGIISTYHANFLKTYGMISEDQLAIYKKGKDLQRGFYPFNRAEVAVFIFLLYVPLFYWFIVYVLPILGLPSTVAIFLLVTNYMRFLRKRGKKSQRE